LPKKQIIGIIIIMGLEEMVGFFRGFSMPFTFQKG
jgi:hypothetical protein